MEIFPAIDLKDGKAVRLFQGDYDKVTVYEDEPLNVALDFQKKGARNLHLVDLDGAKDGKLVNFDQIKKIVENTDMFIEVGGGIRDMNRIDQYLSLGVDRVIIGTIAIKEPELLKTMVDKYKGKIVVGVDARDGYVAINGWKEVTDKKSFEFCEYLRNIGVKTVIYTDISKDGGLQGTNIDAYKELKKIDGLNIVASGGISFEEEITKIKDLAVGAILGKAIYTGKLDLTRALELARI